MITIVPKKKGKNVGKAVVVKQKCNSDELATMAVAITDSNNYGKS